MVVTRSGLLIAEDIPPIVNKESFAAMSAAIFGSGERVTQEMKKGSVKKIIVETDQGRIVTVDAGEKALLACTTLEPNLELIFIEMEKASEKMKKILG